MAVWAKIPIVDVFGPVEVGEIIAAVLVISGHRRKLSPGTAEIKNSIQSITLRFNYNRAYTIYSERYSFYFCVLKIQRYS